MTGHEEIPARAPVPTPPVLPGILVFVSVALVLRLVTGGGGFELGGTRWLSLRSLDRLVLIAIALVGIGATIDLWCRNTTLSALLRAGLRSQPDRFLWLVLGGGVALRLTLYIANPIGLFPYLVAEETISQFLLTNVFVLGGTWLLHETGRRTGDPGAGLLAAILFTLSPWTAYFGRFHLQQAAAFVMVMAGALCCWRWLHRTGRAVPAIGFTALAILLDPVNFHLVGVVLIVWWCGSDRSWGGVAAVLGTLLGLSMVVRATFVSSTDLWMPVFPSLSSLNLDRTTLAILYDRFLVLVLPAGGSVLFLLGMLPRGRRQLLAPGWFVCAAVWMVWVDNLHLVQSAIYFPFVAVGSLVAAQGATWILAVSDRNRTLRNLGFLVVVALIVSVWWGHDYAFRRIYRWNTALVREGRRVPMSLIDGFRRHGAWYWVTDARTANGFADPRFFEAMAERYGLFTRFNRVVFPILRSSTDYYRATSGLNAERVPRFLEGEELRTQVGRIVFDGLAGNGYAMRADEAGAVGYSPQLGYGLGQYAVDFRLRIGGGKRRGFVARLDVVRRDGREVLTRRDLTGEESRGERGYSEVTLAVSVDRPESVQLRVFSTGVRRVWIDRIRIRRVGTLPPER